LRVPTSRHGRVVGLPLTANEAGDAKIGGEREQPDLVCVPAHQILIRSSRRLRRPILRAKRDKRRAGMEKLSGKTVLVTGSTDGVGRLVDRKLGEAGARVLVHGRDADRGARVVADMEASGGARTFLAADLSALAEVRRLAGAVRATADRLDILINNAGIGTADPRQTSAEGFELRFAVNYLAGFLLTSLLLPLVKKSTPARIVNVSSAGQQPIDFGDVMLTRGYPRL
jgi:hypothetical protein